MLDDFMLRALLAGIAVALATAPLGCFVLWRRMAYFGDATAHAAILGVALALWFSVSVPAGVLLTSLLMALLVSALMRRGHGIDAALGVLSHSALAIGVVAISFLPGVRLDLQAFLFGDILAIAPRDLALIWGGAIVVTLLLAWRWQSLLTATVSEDLAFASGLDPRREQLILALTLALVVAIALKLVGALLISAMLIIPAAAARPLARNPGPMALIALLIALLAVCGGLGAASWLDTPAGPGIVTAAAILFALTHLAHTLRKALAGLRRLKP